MQVAAGQLDVVDAQGERLAVRVGRRGFAGRQFEQLREVELAVLAEQEFGARFVQLDIGQVQGSGPQAIDLQVGVEPFEGDLLLARFADIQPPEGQLQAEGVELQALDAGGHRGVVRQLLVGDAQGDARQNKKSQQAI